MALVQPVKEDGYNQTFIYVEQQNLQCIVIAHAPLMIKTAVTVYIRNISQADMQTMFANKIKDV
jgi:hypothetical protein